MKRQLRIRNANADDVPTLVEFLIRLDAHVAGVDPEILALTDVGKKQLQERIESFLKEPGMRLVVVIDANSRPVAMGGIHITDHSGAWLNPERQDLRSACIDDIWVEPEYRGAGVARMIVSALLDFAEDEGIREASLEYALHNPEAEAFWSGLGFRPVGVRAAAPVSDVRAQLSRQKRTRRK